MLDRIRVIRLYEQRRGSMTQEDMAKEGFTNLNEFQRRWAEHYQFLVDEQAVWVEEFEYLGPDRNL